MPINLFSLEIMITFANKLQNAHEKDRLDIGNHCRDIGLW
jgi:hypothetical protein